jgi:4-hydroxy-2-oxoheptanedioate aldolase
MPKNYERYMKKNLLKEKLANGEVAFGVFISEPALMIIEIIGLLDFDYLYIDCEHSPMSFESVAHLIRTAELHGLTPLVRVPENCPKLILRYLDVGAMGVIIPDIDSGKMAQEAVRAVKFPPEGERGLATSARVASFSLGQPLREYIKTANLETMVLGVVESAKGVEHIEEILATEGLDGVTVGPVDLSASLGVAGQVTHPLVSNSVNKVLAAVEKTGKIVGMIPHAGESPKEYVKRNIHMIGIPLNTLVIRAGRQFLRDAQC